MDVRCSPAQAQLKSHPGHLDTPPRSYTRYATPPSGPSRCTLRRAADISSTPGSPAPPAPLPSPPLPPPAAVRGTPALSVENTTFSRSSSRRACRRRRSSPPLPLPSSLGPPPPLPPLARLPLARAPAHSKWIVAGICGRVPGGTVARALDCLAAAGARGSRSPAPPLHLRRRAHAAACRCHMQFAGMGERG
jgi:hypothetical protein